MVGHAKDRSGSKAWPAKTTADLARCSTHPGPRPGRAHVSQPGLA
jgi:hypothetical protein